MSSQAFILTSLNPFAPEYNPIPPGIAPPALLLPPPLPSAAYDRHHPSPSSSLQQPPPFFLSTQIFTYIPSIPHNTQQLFYTNYSTYYVTPQDPNPSPELPAPPQEEVVIHYGQPAGRGQRRGSRGGRGRGRGREISSRVEKNGGGFNSNFERKPKFNERKSLGFWRDDQFTTLGMQKEGNRHQVMPLKREEIKTTVMIKNIPYDCPRKELISFLDEFCSLENAKLRTEGTSRNAADEHLTSAYDFLYLPIDFRTRKSRGFAFVNFTNAIAVWKFFEAFHLKKWDFGSFVQPNKWTKKIEIVSAKIQGKEALIKHFSQSTFDCETDEFLPVYFDPPRNGSGQTVQLTALGQRRAISHHKA